MIKSVTACTQPWLHSCAAASLHSRYSNSCTQHPITYSKSNHSTSSSSQVCQQYYKQQQQQQQQQVLAAAAATPGLHSASLSILK
jgi:hypothetical protein